jgi:hypothetical protein
MSHRLSPPPAHLELHDGYARYAPQGKVSLVQASDDMSAVIAYCREQRIGRLLADARGLDGIAAPTLVDRFWMAEDWAQQAGGQVIVALVARPDCIDPRKFGVMVANDLGLVSDVFAEEAEARAWLLQR